MTREEIAIGLAKDEGFKGLSSERQQAVFEDAVKRSSEQAQTSFNPMQAMESILAPAKNVFSGAPQLSEIPRLLNNVVSGYSGGIIPTLSQLPPITSEAGQLTNLASTGASMGLGIPGKAFSGANAAFEALAPQLKNRLLGRILQRGVAGATGGVATNLLQPKTYGQNATLGATANIVLPPLIDSTVNLARNIYRITNTPLRARFVDSIRSALLQSKKLAGETFGSKIDTLVAKFPDKTVDVSGIVGEVQQRSMNNPAFKALVLRGVRNDQESALMQSILNQPETATNLSLKDAQSVKQVFGRVLKQKFNQVSPEFTDAHLDALDIWHELRAAQLEAFPEFSDIAAGYRKAITNFRTVKPYLTKAALEPNLLNNFGNKAEIMQSVRELLPKETLQEITHYVHAAQAMKLAGRAAVVAGTGTLAGMGFEGARRYMYHH